MARGCKQYSFLTGKCNKVHASLTDAGFWPGTAEQRGRVARDMTPAGNALLIAFLDHSEIRCKAAGNAPVTVKLRCDRVERGSEWNLSCGRPALAAACQSLRCR